MSAILVHTFKEAIRAKWLVMFTVVFFLLAVNIPFLVLLATQFLPPNYLDVYLAYLVSLSFPFLPLLALPMGATSIVDERESGVLQFILSNPISRAEFFVGKFMGLLLATTVVIVFGYGTAAILAYRISVAGYLSVGIPMAVGAALNALMLGLSLSISVLSKRRATALGLSIFAWFLFTVLSDLGFLSVILSLTNNLTYALPLIYFNPVETARLLAVVQTGGGPSQLGATGVVVVELLGDSATLVLTGSLLIWIMFTSAVSFALFRHRDPI